MSHKKMTNQDEFTKDDFPLHYSMLTKSTTFDYESPIQVSETSNSLNDKLKPLIDDGSLDTSNLDNIILEQSGLMKTFDFKNENLNYSSTSIINEKDNTILHNVSYTYQDNLCSHPGSSKNFTLLRNSSEFIEFKKNVTTVLPCLLQIYNLTATHKKNKIYINNITWSTHFDKLIKLYKYIFLDEDTNDIYNFISYQNLFVELKRYDVFLKQHVLNNIIDTIPEE